MRSTITLSFLALISSNILAQHSIKPDLAFIENKGQITDQNGKVNHMVRYMLTMPGINVHLTTKGFSYDTYSNHKTVSASNKHKNPIALFNRYKNSGNEKQKIINQFHRIDIVFEGANEHVQIIPGKRCDDYVNYYGKIRGELIQVHKFKTIIYKNLYNGIDLELTAGNSEACPFEYNFYVQPGADAGLIKIAYKGAISTKLSSLNSVLIQTIHGTIEEKIPLSFEKESEKKINVRYIKKESNLFGFAVGNYDRSKTLIIDPTPNRAWATYYGGSAAEFSTVHGLAINTNGDVYMTGTSESSSSIATTGAHQAVFGGDGDAFLVKFNSEGIRQWASYYGGIGYDDGFSIAIDASGFIILAGSTNSTTGISTAGAHQASLAGDDDGFIVKFNDDGVRQWGTYYGGVLQDKLFSVCTSGTDILFAGYSASNSPAIATVGSHQPNNGGGEDGFFGKFNTNGIRQWASFYGGINSDFIFPIDVDALGNILIAGLTYSSTGIATTGSHQPAMGGGGFGDGFLAKFTSSGVRQWGTYYGGIKEDAIADVASDINGNIYICGTAESETGISTTGAHQFNFGGGFADGMIVKFNSNGVRQWSTYYGGAGEYDVLYSIDVTADGTVFSGGIAEAGGNYATNDAHQLNFGGGSGDGILVKFNTNGVRQWGTYYGGANYDDFHNVFTINGTTIYAAGTTESMNNIATSGSYQAVSGGGSDIFLVKFTDVISGVPLLLTENVITLYPNPVKEEFVIKFNNTNNPFIYELYDVLGKLVKTESVIVNTSPLRVSIKGLQAGSYFIKIFDIKHRLIVTKQIIIKD